MREINAKDLNLIRLIARRYDNYDYNELVSEGCLGLMAALNKLEEEDCCEEEKEFNYIFSSIRNAIVNAIKRINLYNDRSICLFMEDQYDDILNQEENMIRKEGLIELQEKIQGCSKTMTPREKYVLYCHILRDKPETLRSIAKKFKCSKDSILRDKKRIIEKCSTETKQ